MKRIAPLLSVLIVAICAPACSSVAPTLVGGRAAVKAPAATPERPEPVATAPRDRRKVGDFAVHRFSGSFQKTPLTLTEEVIGEEAGWWVIDYTFEEQSGTSKLRVRFDPRTDSVRRVARLEGGREVTVPLAEYERMMERTSFAADDNDGLLTSTSNTCLVGPSELDCETKTYRVRIGEEEARLVVSHSAQVLGGDVLGDITTKDGKLIYRSELLETGNGSPEKRGVAVR